MTSSDHLRLNHIAGAWHAPAGAKFQPKRNPGDLTDVIGEFPESSADDVTEAVDAASEAAAAWSRTGPVERAEYLYRLERLLHAHADDLAHAITREHGKPLRDARGEVARACAITAFFAGEGRRLGGRTAPADDNDTLALTFRAPIGVVGLITPWNFPLAIPVWKLAPALVSGCTVVMKPSPFTPLTAALLTDLVTRAGLPTGVVNLVQGGRTAGEALAADARVRGVSFTGSVPVGRAIQIAGAPRFLRTQLEMGGKNAVIVLADADLDRAAAAVVHGAFGQSGQRCSATSRLVADVRIKEQLIERIVASASRLRVGPGLDERSDLGPLISAERLAACEEAVAEAVCDGAVLRLGGDRPSRDTVPDGHYFRPTVVDGADPGSPLAQEEIFGPVLTVLGCDGYEDAIALANGVRYGMSGTLFTRDSRAMFAGMRDLEAGMIHINRPGVGAYPHLPHVGTKESQAGPAECSAETLDFYTETRSACLDYS
ncbi:aldehyde dehydrogenase family protein [Streptomyces roseifaciens]|uniref:aldehyde dehydrogenase family protein n=1 Tax=Streptomyces roseifaciens TaxID=1488406 RepID=UPI000717FCE3|nr:aldehyde dehydrogenase family protein [Streptomyces roseifaciens]